MNSESTSKSGLGQMVETVNQTVEETKEVSKVTSNEMFKSSVMNFMQREMDNMDTIEVAQARVTMKLLDQMEEESMDVGEMMRFSELLSKQKTGRINALFDILKPTRESSNPLLNDSKEESSAETTNLSSSELQTMLKLMNALGNVQKEE